MDLNQITLPALDVEASAAFYRDMGFNQIVSSPHYARFECRAGDATFSVHAIAGAETEAYGEADGEAAMRRNAASGVVTYFECDDLDQRVQRLVERGLAFDLLPTDQPWLWREARLRDPSGNVLCLYRAGENRRHPPWRIPEPTTP